jgi:threonine/homoserine/homoserine lactone efflux protein
MSLDTYLLYLAAVAVFFATPPDSSQLLIVSNAIRHGLRRSLWTVAGDLGANVLQMSAAAFGLAAIIATSATAFWWIKWLGVVYLAWIGLRLMLGRSGTSSPQGAASAQTAFRLFRQGFLTSAANPFAVVFFGALFPQFIDPSAAILPQLLVLGATYIAVDGVILIAWGWLGRRAAGALHSLGARWINRICGALMFAAAALLAFRDMGQAPAPRLP